MFCKRYPLHCPLPPFILIDAVSSLIENGKLHLWLVEHKNPYVAVCLHLFEAICSQNKVSAAVNWRDVLQVKMPEITAKEGWEAVRWLEKNRLLRSVDAERVSFHWDYLKPSYLDMKKQMPYGWDKVLDQYKLAKQ